MIENYPYSTEYIEEAAAYVRVSTTEQKMHGLSIESQKQKLIEYADKNGIKIVDWYIDEGVSGRKPIAKRPQLQRMIQDAESGRFKRIIFIKLDRFFRSLAEYHEAMKRIDPVIWTATEEKYDLSTANGRAFVNMKLTIAELEADTGGERVKLVNEYKVKEGMPLFGTQCFPFCYGVGEPEEGERHKYVVKKDEEIMEDLIAHVMVNRSVRAAMVYVNNKYNRKLAYGVIRKALSNEMICGTYKGNPNYCTPYISREMYEKLQAIVKRSPRTSQTEHTYLFAGLIRCPDCGWRLTGGQQNHYYKGKRTIYYGYRCNKNKVHKNCSFKKEVQEKRIEEELLLRLEDIVEQQELRSIEIRQQTEKVSKYNIEELQEELNRLNYSWQKGRIKTVEEYDTKYDKLTAQIEAATAEITEAMDAPDFEQIRAVLSSGWKETYNELDDEHKRAFWRSFIEEISVEWERGNRRIVDIKFF
jgi:DNA invertase Pin-like site-specific DNA recombinase